MVSFVALPCLRRPRLSRCPTAGGVETTRIVPVVVVVAAAVAAVVVGWGRRMWFVALVPAVQAVMVLMVLLTL